LTNTAIYKITFLFFLYLFMPYSHCHPFILLSDLICHPFCTWSVIFFLSSNRASRWSLVANEFLFLFESIFADKSRRRSFPTQSPT
jgi:hypothetical protein